MFCFIFCKFLLFSFTNKSGLILKVNCVQILWWSTIISRVSVFVSVDVIVNAVRQWTITVLLLIPFCSQAQWKCKILWQFSHNFTRRNETSKTLLMCERITRTKWSSSSPCRWCSSCVFAASGFLLHFSLQTDFIHQRWIHIICIETRCENW